MTDMATRPADHPNAPRGRVGLVLLNLGTPDATDYWSMRRYLNEFLSDRRVIDYPRLLWQPLLQLVILSKRPFSSGEAYRSIWNDERDESPLRTVTRSQAEKVAARLAGVAGDRLVVDWAMRYGNPSIDSKLQALQGEGCERILVVPLYPQYAAATTATVNDKVFESLMKMRWQPAVRTAPAYHDDPAYIDALACSMEQSLAALDFAPEVVLASFHGIPLSYFRKGDPYHCHCQKTARLLRARLGWPDEKLLVTFQSRFGPEEWLQPYTDKTVERLAREGVRRIAVVTPGFAADCLETLEEIAGENAEIFHEHGGKDFAFLPSLNDSPEGMSVIGAIARRELSGWL